MRRKGEAMAEPENLIPKHGGYGRLKNFQITGLFSFALGAQAWLLTSRPWPRMLSKDKPESLFN